MTSVLNSVKNNNARILQVLVAVPGSVHPQDLRHGLFHACREGFVECLQCLLGASVDPEIQDSSGNTPLHLAAKSGRVEVLKVLIKAGCNVDSKGCGGNTALHLSSKHGHEECTTFLVTNGAKLNAQDSAGNTPLIAAIQNTNYSAVKILLKSRCKVNVTNGEGRSALHYACHKAQCVDMLLASGADPNILDMESNTPAMLAAAEGFSGVIKILLEAGYNVNLQNSYTGRTALHTVAMKGHQGCVENMILAGADINIYDKQFRTPLWYAIDCGRFEVVKFLFRANSHVDKFKCSSEIPRDACPVNLILTKKLFHVLRLFILTGYDNHHVREYLDDEKAKKLLTEEDLYHWFDHASGPLTLKQICRLWIRHHQGPLLFHDLELLPIPGALKEFLSLKEIDDEHWN